MMSAFRNYFLLAVFTVFLLASLISLQGPVGSVGRLWAAEKVQEFPYIVEGEVDVYAKPEGEAWPVMTLAMGDRFRYVGGDYGDYRKIAFRFKGRLRAGYVLGTQVDSNASAEMKRKHPAAGAMLNQRWLTASLVGSYQQQGQRDLQTSADSIYEVTEFAGSTTFLGLGVDWPIRNDWALRSGLSLRKVSMEGSATAEGASTSQGILLEYQMVSLELALKHYFAAPARWVLSGGLEIAKTTGADLTVTDGPPLAETDIEFPTFYILSGGLHYDWSLGKEWAVEPGLKLGVIANAQPVILLSEGVLHIKYAF
jgi:hypothetical protein